MTRRKIREITVNKLQLKPERAECRNVLGNRQRYVGKKMAAN